MTVAVTHDGGTSWDYLPPVGQVLSTVACVAVTTCDVVRTTVGAPARFLFSWTTDGGQHWASVPAPSALSIADPQRRCLPGNITTCLTFALGAVSLSCTTVTSCVIVASSPGPVSSKGASWALEFATHDGGLSWSEVTLPSGFLASQGQCSIDGSCVITGEKAGRFATLYSSDDGATWAWASAPAVPLLPARSSCTNSSAGCAHLASPVSLSCSDASGCVVMLRPGGVRVALLVSKNGGRSWSEMAPPRLPAGEAVTSVSCPTSSYCWASGDIWPPKYGYLGGLIASTTNGGATWQTNQLPPSMIATVDGGVGIGAVSCATSKVCFALGSSGGDSMLLTYKA